MPEYDFVRSRIWNEYAGNDVVSKQLCSPLRRKLSWFPRRIHGGSFIVGSASGPGLDGAALAEATGSIVAVVQYRLGAFGFLSPDGETNLAVNDVITALNFLRRILPGLNGNPDKIIVAGQSSGASMVRALLATPSAAGLFQSAILQSDPMVRQYSGNKYPMI